MTDRVPGRPRRYKITLEDSGAGTVIYGVIEYADEPVTVGTPINKETMLPDALAAMICPDIADPTPANALDGLRKGAGWLYTAVFPRDGWAADTSAPGYSYSQTVSCTPVDGGTAFTSTTATDAPMVNLTGTSGDTDLLQALAIVAKGYRVPMAGQIKVYINELPTVDNLQIYMRGREIG